MRLQGSFAGGGYDVGSEMGCADVNECAMRSAPLWGDKASCVNLHGGYDCQCPSGFERENNMDGFTLVRVNCIDENECDVMNFCHNYANCVNTAGYYRCE